MVAAPAGWRRQWALTSRRPLGWALGCALCSLAPLALLVVQVLLSSSHHSKWPGSFWHNPFTNKFTGLSFWAVTKNSDCQIWCYLSLIKYKIVSTESLQKDCPSPKQKIPSWAVGTGKRDRATPSSPFWEVSLSLWAWDSPPPMRDTWKFSLGNFSLKAEPPGTNRMPGGTIFFL